MAAGPGATTSLFGTTALAATLGTYAPCSGPTARVVAIYYFTDEASGPERYIGATIWTPPAM